MGLVCINGGQGGGINVPWGMGRSILGLGPSDSLVFHIIDACSLLLLSVKEGDCDGLPNRYVGFLFH